VAIDAHDIAPARPPIIMYIVTSSGFRIPFTIVIATANKNGPKFAAAINTACNGFRTRVPITVATEFADRSNHLQNQTQVLPLLRLLLAHPSGNLRVF
jgi:hypothetical protein